MYRGKSWKVSYEWMLINWKCSMTFIHDEKYWWIMWMSGYLRANNCELFLLSFFCFSFFPFPLIHLFNSFSYVHIVYLFFWSLDSSSSSYVPLRSFLHLLLLFPLSTHSLIQYLLLCSFCLFILLVSRFILFFICSSFLRSFLYLLPILSLVNHTVFSIVSPLFNSFGF